MKQKTLLIRGVSLLALSSLLVLSSPVQAAAPRVSSLKIGRDTIYTNASLTTGEYAQLSLVVQGASKADLSVRKLNAGRTDFDAAATKSLFTSYAGSLIEMSSTVKIDADNTAFFPSANTTYLVNVDTGNATTRLTAPIKIHVFSPIKFNEDSFEVTLTGQIADTLESRESVVLKQGVGQMIQPKFGYQAGSVAAEKTFLVAGSKEIQIGTGATISVATSADALPAGKYKAFLRGYNYADIKDTKKISAKSASYVNLTVLAKPVLSKVYVDDTAKKDGVKPANCITSGYGAGDDKIVLKWDGASVTSVVVTSGTGTFEVKSAGGLGKVYNLDADCLTGTGVKTITLTPQNTADYKATGAGIVSKSVTVN